MEDGITAALVSIRAPAWGATFCHVFQVAICVFQFALPRGERLMCLATLAGLPGFNSRSRVGSDAALQVFIQQLIVSIRAPAWGATGNSHHPAQPRPVSIRAPAWGATHPFVLFCSTHSVSIRAPAWGATKVGHGWLLNHGVSIRAPAWGATNVRRAADVPHQFQFALPRGERRQSPPPRPALPRFNSRSRVGSDYRYSRKIISSACFNSRSRVGSDTDDAGR